MKFNPGFRISILDICVIIAAISSSVYVYMYSWLASGIILFVVAHFFLFCNITRMSRIPELIWASLFIVLTVLSIRFELFPWFVAATLSVFLTVVLVILESRKPSYHGMFWEKINPELPQWYSNNTSAGSSS
jgi:predicted membrane protein